MRCTWRDEPDEVSIEGDGDKMSNQPWYRNHFATGAELCPVKALDHGEWFCLVDGKVSLVDPKQVCTFCGGFVLWRYVNQILKCLKP